MSDDSFDRHVAPHVRVVRMGSLRLYPFSELKRFVLEQSCRPLGDR